jgi:hypothetical protein
MKKIITLLAINLFWQLQLQAQVEDVLIPEIGCPINTTSTNPANYDNDADPTDDNKWDWLVDNYTVFITQNGQGTEGFPVLIRSPFYDISGNPNTYEFVTDVEKDNKPENGWELLYKNFGNEIQGINKPFFILYNRYTGVMRVFMNIINSGDFPYNAAKIELAFKGTDLRQTALLNQLGSHTFSFMDFQPDVSQVVPLPYVNSGVNDNYFWVWADFNTLYDPCTCGVESEMIINISLINQINISLTGLLTQKTIVDAVDQNLSSVDNSIWSTIQQYSQFGSGIINGIGEIAASGTKAHKDGVKMLQDVQGNLQTLAPILGKQTTNNVSSSLRRFLFEFPKVNQILNLANSFISVVKKINGQFDALSATPANISNPKLTETKTEVAITGDLTLSGNIFDRKFILPGSKTSNDFAVNEYKPIYNNVLGVFNLSEQPEFEIVKYNSGFSYVAAYEQEFDNYVFSNFPAVNHLKIKNKPKLLLNPASNLKIKSVEYKIVFTNEEYASDVFSDHELPKITGPMIPGDFKYFANFGSGNYNFVKSDKNREDLLASFGYNLDVLDPNNNNSSNWNGAIFSTPFLHQECFIKTGIFSFSEINKPALRVRVILEPIENNPLSEVNEVIVIYTYPANITESTADEVYIGTQNQNNDVFIDLPIDESQYIFGKYGDLVLENTTIKEDVNVIGDLTIGNNVNFKPGYYAITASGNINYDHTVSFVPYTYAEITENNPTIFDYKLDFIAGNEIYTAAESFVQPEITLQIEPSIKFPCENLEDEQATGEEIAAQCNSPKYKELISAGLKQNPIDSTISTDNNSYNEPFNFNLYPNPATSSTTIQVLGNYSSFAKIILYDVMGKEQNIQVENQENNFTIELSNLAKGIYLVKVSTIDESKTKQLLIK